MGKVITFACLLATLVACAPRAAAPAQSSQPAAPAYDPRAVADFYRGKTVSIVVGFGPGGGFDTYGRLLAKHMGKHIPGEPNLIVENMDGAGSLIAANHLYNVARPDGLTIGVFNEQQFLNQATGVEGVQFDARKFGILGSVVKSSTACTIRADSPYNTAEDMRRRDLPPLIVGGTSVGANTDDMPKLLNATLGFNMRVVSGYAGTSAIRLATESGEVQGMCWSWDSVVSTARNWLETGFIKVLVYQAPERDPRIEDRFPGARRAEDLAPNEENKRIIRAGMATGALAKTFVAPPDTPPDRLKALQDAFSATMNDPEFLADTAQARLEPDPNSAAVSRQIIEEILSLPPDLSRRLADIRK